MSPNREDWFADRILEWHDSNGRHDLPWRAPDTSPFEVLVAELMLQQTSVEQVLSVYPEFVERYRRPDAVADAAEADLAEDIRPLGLSKRVGYFVRACERILEEHDGRVPTDLSDLLELHGVGEYTACSVLAHVHGEDAPAVTRTSREFSLEFSDSVPLTSRAIGKIGRLLSDSRLLDGVAISLTRSSISVQRSARQPIRAARIVRSAIFVSTVKGLDRPSNVMDSRQVVSAEATDF